MLHPKQLGMGRAQRLLSAASAAAVDWRGVLARRAVGRSTAAASTVQQGAVPAAPLLMLAELAMPALLLALPLALALLEAARVWQRQGAAKRLGLAW